jgi:hypothetical protein
MFGNFLNSSSGVGTSLTPEQTQKLNSIDTLELELNRLDYGFNTNPYPTPTTLDEAKAQAKAQVSKKRQDYISGYYSATSMSGDQVELNAYNHILHNGGTLSSNENDNRNLIAQRMAFLIQCSSVEDGYITQIDVATTIADAIAISDGADFSTVVWSYDD